MHISYVVGDLSIAVILKLCEGMHFSRSKNARLLNFKLLNVTINDLAYLGYDRSYERNTVIVQATAGHQFNILISRIPPSATTTTMAPGETPILTLKR